MRRSILFLLPLLLASACGGTSNEPADAAGSSADASPILGRDAGPAPDGSLAPGPDATVASGADAAATEGPDAAGEPPDAAMMEMPDATMMQRPDAAMMGMPDASMMEAPDAAMMGMPDAATMEMPDAAPMEMPDAAMMEMPDAAMMEMPDAAAPGPDAGGAGGCFAGFAGCSSYVDATAPGANRTISFSCCQYTPSCLRIAAGQSVTFSGNFGFHPLEQSCGPADVIASTGSGSSATFAFPTPGDYGYFCTVHGLPDGTGMAGAIEVVP